MGVMMGFGGGGRGLGFWLGEWVEGERGRK